MNIEELDQVFATAAIVNKHFPNTNGNGSAEDHHSVALDDLREEITLNFDKVNGEAKRVSNNLEVLEKKHYSILTSHKEQIDNLIIKNAQLLANQQVLIEWVKASTSAEKGRLRAELSEDEERITVAQDDAPEYVYSDVIQTPNLHKKKRPYKHNVITTPRPYMSKDMKKRLVYVKKWLVNMFEGQKKILASDLRQLAEMDNIKWPHVNLVKNYFMKGAITVHKTGGNRGKKSEGNRNQKWEWHLKEEV